MNFGKLRHLLLVGLCAVVLFALKAYQQPSHTVPRTSARAETNAQPSASAAAAFDYYVLSLSWSPEYCATEARPNDSQCQRSYAFVVHGLWPQNEQGYPENCGEGEYLDSDIIQRMLPLMPSKPLIIHEWKRHGVCTGLGAGRYFDTVTQAQASITIPPAYQGVKDYLTTDVDSVKAAFVAANPALKPDMLAVQCKDHYLQEVRICLTTTLTPRACSRDVRDHCGQDLVLRPTR
jgi:ribonuclease T2